MNTYTRIFFILKDHRWHSKADFCRPYSQDDRRLREMKERGWIDYKERALRAGPLVLYTEYKLTEIFSAWWEYAKKFGILREELNGQLNFV